MDSSLGCVMSVKAKLILFFAIFIVVTLCSLLFIDFNLIDVLNPKGMIASKQRNLIVISTLLMLIVVIPVFVIACIVALKYRANNAKAKYSPEFETHTGIEIVWWSVPCAIVLVLAILAWKSCHELDPFKPIENGTKPIKIQVVALQWKWLFIYPEQQIATVNFVQFPEKTPIYFEITGDAPMNSFWIPSLSGQVFAMSGMRTKLHMIADEIGEFKGASANLSGRGFSGMSFVVKASSQNDFDEWVDSVKEDGSGLNLEAYKQLAEPTEYHPAAFYSLRAGGLFDWIIMKYMKPMPEMQTQKMDRGSVY